MPVLASRGDTGLPAKLPTLDIWGEYAADVTGVELAECGHFLAEEQPRAVLDHLRAFLTR